MTTEKLACIILAAGKGVRMKSSFSKPLHCVAGRPMVNHVIAAAEELSPERIIVIAADGDQDLTNVVRPHEVAIQPIANGTGGAARIGAEALGDFDGDVLILFGDSPLVTSETLRRMLAARRQSPQTGVVFAGMRLSEPGNYGRMVIGDDGSLDRIVEYKETTPEQKKINLCNGSVVCADGSRLRHWLQQLSNDNVAGEYYLTDLPQIARRENRLSQVVEVCFEDMAGCNNRVELANLEQIFQKRLRDRVMVNGATLIDPDSVFLCWDTEIGQDVIIGPNVTFGPGVRIENNATIHPYCHIEGAMIEQGASVGPFARLRPGTRIGQQARVGNFVETKNAVLSKEVKAGHLSYLGDVEIGENSNIGAGTITCNYDGFSKHRTTIEAQAFIGSNTALVAPVKIGAGALVAAGSTITKDVPNDALAIARGTQENINDGATKFKNKQAHNDKDKT